jgi:hypothetical protein
MTLVFILQKYRLAGSLMWIERQVKYSKEKPFRSLTHKKNGQPLIVRLAILKSHEYKI